MKFCNPSFSYHEKVFDEYVVNVISKSLSPSISATATALPLLPVSIDLFEKPCDPSFSYHASSSPPSIGTTKSMSPSRSRSTGHISLGLLTDSSIVFSVKLCDPLFSYQRSLEPGFNGTKISISLSKSRSKTVTETGPSIENGSGVVVNDGVAFEMLVGVVLAKVAEPPLMENAKSPTSNAPLPELVSYTSSLSFTVTVLLSLATLVPETIVGAVAS